MSGKARLHAEIADLKAINQRIAAVVRDLATAREDLTHWIQMRNNPEVQAVLEAERAKATE